MSGNSISTSLHVQDMYESYFLEYASYVITDRAVPYAEDGLKPVQRRILHSLFEMNDGRFHKAANVIGNTMKFHPHGDAAIRDALVNVAQKGLMIDTQGNWGDPVTGDSAAAPRYIECKLTPFALEIAFNRRTTVWQSSYDGRNKEPVALPVKFPLLLAQGAEGIAVGLSTKIMPHNFRELIECCIKILKKESFTLFPDFLSGGFVDVSEYNDGKAGGRIKVRARIEKGPKRTLIIREVPFGTTTGNLMDSIVAANEKGKLKIKRIEDNTAQNVEIVVHLPPGVDEDKAIDALYAFTDCESAISPNCCVIRDRKPHFMGVSDLLRENVKDAVRLLKLELEIKQKDLQEKWHMRTLERIFIEERIYRKIEKCETWDAIIKTIREGLQPFSKNFIREVTVEDIERLTEIKIKRISRFDSKKADEELIALEKGMKEVARELKNLTKFAIRYFEDLLKRYGQGRERKTRLETFEEIAATEVILSNLRVGYDSKSGFLGTGVKGDGAVTDCSKLDDIIVITEEGSLVVTKVADKTYVGKNIIYAARFDKNNRDTIYNLVYRDGRTGSAYIKRFAVGGVTRDKQYALTQGKDHSKVHHLSISTPVTRDVLQVKLVPKPRIKKEFEARLGDYEVKGRGSRGNILTKYGIRRVNLISGQSTSSSPSSSSKSNGASKAYGQLSAGKPSPQQTATQKTSAVKNQGKGRAFYWDKRNQLAGFGVKGEKVCQLGPEDHVLLLYDDGSYITYPGGDSFEVGDGILHMDVWNSDHAFSAIYLDGNDYAVYAKRFRITSQTDEKYYYYISDYEDSELLYLTAQPVAVVDVHLKPLKGSKRDSITLSLDDERFPVKKVSHPGEQITTRAVKKITASQKNQLSLL